MSALICPKCGEEIFDWNEQKLAASEGVLAQQANRLISLAREIIRLREPGNDRVTDQDWINLLTRADQWMADAQHLKTADIHIVHGTVG